MVEEVKPGVVQIFTSTGNGDDWWVYDVQEYSRSKEGLRGALVSETSILFEESSKVARDLEIIRRNSNWGETTLQRSEFLREHEHSGFSEHRHHSIRAHEVDYGPRQPLQAKVPGTPAGEIP